MTPSRNTVGLSPSDTALCDAARAVLAYAEREGVDSPQIPKRLLDPLRTALAPEQSQRDLGSDPIGGRTDLGVMDALGDG